MKKIFYFIVYVTVVCCARITETTITQTYSADESNEYLTIEEALGVLNDFEKSFNINTPIKSQDNIDKIETLHPFDTKGETADQVLAYVINYKNEKGFAIVNANKKSVPIIAITESGRFDTHRLQEKMMALTVYQTKSTSTSTEVIEMDSPENFIYSSIANSLSVQPRIAVDTLSVTYGDWTNVYQYGPHVKVKWGQKYPFNMMIPPHPYWSDPSNLLYRGLPPVGCTNIAVGQILATVRQPAVAPGTNSSHNWDRLTSISNYQNIMEYLPGETSYAFENDYSQMCMVEELADYLYTIFELNHSSTTDRGTSSNIYYARNTMMRLSEVYFKNALVRDYTSNDTPLVNCVKNNRPVYCRGEYTDSNNNTYGHAWVIDGYSKREREITIVTQTGYMAPEERVRTQSAYFFHINWGYSGLYDGYYYKGIFDMAGRQGFNAHIDTNPNTSNGSKAYTQDIMYISY